MISTQVLIERAAVVLLVLWVAVRVTSLVFKWGPDLSGRMGAVRRGAGGWLAALAVAVALAFVLNYPVEGWDGLSVASIFLSFNTTISVGMIVLVATDLIERISGASLLKRSEVTALAAWNVLVGLVLYAGLFGFLPIDVYSAGFGPSWFFVVLFLLTAALVVAGGAIKWLFIIYICSWAAGALQSDNLFDYITDPLLVAASIVVLIVRGIGARSGRKD